MIVGKIENGLERSFVKHRLNCLLITDPVSFVDAVQSTGALNTVPQSICVEASISYSFSHFLELLEKVLKEKHA